MTIDTKLHNSAMPMWIGDDKESENPALPKNQRELWFSILTDKDYGDLDLYIKSRFIQLAEQNASLLSPLKRKEILSIAIKDSMQIGYDTDDGQEILWQNDGILHIGWISIRKRHPEMTFEMFEQLAKRNIIRSITNILTAYKALNFVEDDDKSGVGGPLTGNDKSGNSDSND